MWRICSSQSRAGLRTWRPMGGKSSRPCFKHHKIENKTLHRSMLRRSALALPIEIQKNNTKLPFQISFEKEKKKLGGKRRPSCLILEENCRKSMWFVRVVTPQSKFTACNFYSCVLKDKKDPARKNVHKNRYLPRLAHHLSLFQEVLTWWRAI